MIVSVIMPAAGAFAATKAPKLSATKKYLHLDKESYNEYDFNITNKVKGWKYKWSSANENVAEVAKNGLVTATGVGTTKVSVVISDKDGDEVDELKATVVVRDNIASVKITNVPTATLAVGASNDFNRSFTTVSGSTKKTSAITRWTVDKDSATISDSGLFVATAAGEYTVTARSFQSTAKYESWLADSTKYASYVLATDSVKVTVAASMVSAKQVDLKNINVTFDTAVTDVATKLTVSKLVGTTKVNQVIKGVSMDADKKVAKVELYEKIADDANTTYVVEYPGMKEVTFVSAIVKPENVTSMEVTTKQAQINKETTVKIALYNKDGVNIATDDLLTRVSLESSFEGLSLAGKLLTMYTVGDTTTLKATYHTYTYDTTTGTEVGNIVVSSVVTCVKEVVDTVNAIKAYTVTSDATASFKTPSHQVAVGDAGYKLVAQLRIDDNDDNDYDVTNEGVNASDFVFISSNEDVLFVADNSGALTPVKAGSANVVVKYKDSVVGSVAITVTERRVVGSITVDNTAFTLSNDSQVQDIKKSTVTVKDQLGSTYSAANYSIRIEAASALAEAHDIVSATVAPVATSTKPAYTFNGALASTFKGTYVYKITAKDDNTGKEVSTWVSITVAEPNGPAVSYKVETNGNTFDTKVDKDNTSKSVTVDVFGYASNGVRTERIDLDTATNMQLIVSYPDSSNVNNPALANETIVLASTASGSAVQKADKGSYRLTLKATAPVGNYASGASLNSTYFTVTDTQTKPVVTVEKRYTSLSGDAAAQDCFKVTLNGDDVNDTFTIYSFELSGSSLFVKQLIYREYIGTTGAYIDHKIDVNTTIKINQ
jgi:hypothetical protein